MPARVIMPLKRLGSRSFLMKKKYHIAVIGAGSGGLVVASGAAGLGADVALIEAHKMGGDCLNYGCIPSKTFLRSAHLSSLFSRSDEFGLSVEKREPVDLGRIMDRVSSVIKEIEPHDSKARYEGLGVDVFEDFGKLKDPHTVVVGDQEISAKYIVIATGSRASIPSIPGLDTVPYLTNETVFSLDKLPKKLIVLGAGSIGLELGQGFRHLGSDVEIVDGLPRIFSKEDPEVAPLMMACFQSEGIQCHLSSRILAVSKSGESIRVDIETNGVKRSLEGDSLLVSLGRRAVTDGLGLDALGIQTHPDGTLVLNRRLQTSVKTIYACGDAAGPYPFTHMAGYQAGIILRNILFKLPAKVDYATVPWVTYTKPEVAHVGLTEPMAIANGHAVDTVQVDLSKLDRAKTDNDRKGFLKATFTKKRLLGVTLVGEKAGEMIPIAALAIQKKMKVTAFLNLIFPYPTESEIFKFASLDVAKRGLKPWMKSLIRRLI